MTSQKKPSRDEIDSKFVDIQNRIIGTLDNTDREQVIKEHLYPLVESIHNSDYFGDKTRAILHSVCEITWTSVRFNDLTECTTAILH